MAPAARDASTQKHANTREPTNEYRCDRSVEIGHGDRGCDRKSDNPSAEGPGAILPREPVESGRSGHRGRHPQDATGNCSNEESTLPDSVSENRADHGPESC